MPSREIQERMQSLKLSTVQREALVGLLLGDGCLESRNKFQTYRLKIEQSARHEAYVRHILDVFRPWVLSGPRMRSSTRNGKEHVSWAFNTVSHAAFRFYGQQFYADQQKQVPRLIHRWLTPRAIAYWFMDDGSIKSRQSKGVIFNTQGFPRQDVERLCDVLDQQFGLLAQTRRQKDGLQIFVSGKSYERFVDLIGPFVIDSMRYKIPNARRT